MKVPLSDRQDWFPGAFRRHQSSAQWRGMADTHDSDRDSQTSLRETETTVNGAAKLDSLVPPSGPRYSVVGSHQATRLQQRSNRSSENEASDSAGSAPPDCGTGATEGDGTIGKPAMAHFLDESPYPAQVRLMLGGHDVGGELEDLGVYEPAQPIVDSGGAGPRHPLEINTPTQDREDDMSHHYTRTDHRSEDQRYHQNPNHGKRSTSSDAFPLRQAEARRIGRRSRRFLSAGSSDVDFEPLLPNSAQGHPRGFRRSILWRCWYKIVGCFYYLRYTFLPNGVSQTERTVALDGSTVPMFFPPNIVRNQKHSVFTLIPKMLCRYFFNLFYLLVALAQFIPPLKVGPLFTYVAPLSFVLAICITKEAYDDYKRYVRDKEINSALYDCYDRSNGFRIKPVPARNLKVGDLVQLHTNQRVPCDMVLLRTPEGGTTFLRTDQLDGETDWKLRRAVAQTQLMKTETECLNLDGWMVVEPPRREIYDFVGTFYSTSPMPKQDRSKPLGSLLHTLTDTECHSSSASLATPITSVENRRTGSIKGSMEEYHRSWDATPGSSPQRTIVAHDSGSTSITMGVDVELGGRQQPGAAVGVRRVSGLNRDECVTAEPLSLENVLWASTVVTSGPVIGIVVYTGAETRSSMNTSAKRTKTGIFDNEINTVSKTLFAILVFVATILVGFKGFRGLWAIYLTRFILLLSSIIPISLRVNIDLARTYYSWLIAHDPKLPSTVVRNSSIPEELGRIDIVLTDKTGTLTCNDMVFRKLHIGRVCYDQHNLDEIRDHLASALLPSAPQSETARGAGRRRLEVWEQLRRSMLGLALCHTVTPTREEGSDQISFQASSPDEIAMTVFASSVGLQLMEARDTHIELQQPDGTSLHFDVLYQFPFSSETKRMGCVVRHVAGPGQETPPIVAEAGRILFFMKGAESVLIPRLEPRGAHWLPEECDNFARTGLRTLVFAVKEISSDELEAFRVKYNTAQTAIQRRAEKVQEVIDQLAKDMTLLALTGVEDRLQQDVPQTLEAFRHAGVRVWMLTGDKIETATCIAISAGLKARQHTLTVLAAKDFASPFAAQEAIESFALGPSESVLAVDGPFIEMALKHFPVAFIRAASECPATICSRCSPTQKADIVRAIQVITKKRAAAIGDGGNDVSMIQAASCGIGIVGKEGRQASLAADYSVTEFRRIHRLLFWHGRLSYQRSAKLAQFVIHRGLTIATIQVIFSALFFFIPMAIFQGWLTVGYATYYTMLPVFSLVLDRDLAEAVVFMFPELYGSLRRGRALSPKTLFAWLWTSVYQGTVIMLGAIVLFEAEFTNIISITFTSLVLAELLNVALEITRWHRLMIAAEICTVVIYFVSIALLPNYFNPLFIATPMFWWKVGIITLISWLPLFCLRMCIKFWQPTRDSKLTF